MLQRELREVERRCQGAEARHEELASNIPEATRPLLRQLEAMQVIIGFWEPGEVGGQPCSLLRGV